MCSADAAKTGAEEQRARAVVAHNGLHLMCADGGWRRRRTEMKIDKTDARTRNITEKTVRAGAVVASRLMRGFSSALLALAM